MYGENWSTETPSKGASGSGRVLTLAYKKTVQSTVENGAMRAKTLVLLPVFNRKIVACEASWDSMQSTDIRGIRDCAMCAREVKAIGTCEEFDEAVRDGFCVAIQLAPLRPQHPIILGNPIPKDKGDWPESEASQ
tara:strand:+ start:1695 stop:2099 length:405 start_codon:yes stop_codon:yes gene_type:complete